MIAVIDYGMGNLHSVSKALETVGAEVRVTSRPDDLREASGIVLPGVGSFAKGIRSLRELDLIPALEENVQVKQKPFLGICLGMQLTAKVGYEHGRNEGLGWFDAEVIHLPSDQGFKIPHMGWDDMEVTQFSPLFKELGPETIFYFVHSYHFVPRDTKMVTGRCQYGIPFVASAGFGNIHLVQFHPEKSQKVGLKVLENFLELTLSFKGAR